MIGKVGQDDERITPTQGTTGSYKKEEYHRNTFVEFVSNLGIFGTIFLSIVFVVFSIPLGVFVFSEMSFMVLLILSVGCIITMIVVLLLSEMEK